ncbi:aminopeptidase N/puromycin-sensitive aminopeptidase [Silvibacterium bohemicum]|uniref:Aminopeptidase n=1 Tax=Silvibacterium bohemicum TaxID=1577686 RepID=A0A841K7W9_9BACT|nr:M1 family metallopeptidase [Silvibacterium bohemicum]MBB6146384.1 aminopeptidase N/puromycin-sensitive aminopeptidase [Silvibacterium bohemicum]
MSVSPAPLFRGALFAALATLSLSSYAQRLPQSVHPEHYRLTLAPNLKDATFTGSEKIDVLLDQPSDSITLNSAEIKFQSVTTELNGKEVKADVTEDAAKEQATFNFNRTLPAGRLTLTIAYTGILNDQLRGFYLSKTAKRNYAVTQFEATDARRAFPSFDEPAFKATFDVTLIVDKGDTAISNTNIVSDTPGPVIGEHAIRFATTPKMSTYLVAFLVGDFQCTSGSSDGTPIRACATPDKVQYTKFALSAAEFVLHYYDTYFGIKYPMPKLDMIALPDFEAGAMENFGAITYRETDLLTDEKTASLGAKKTVGIVVAHEMAHQWFGDMVTMQWWNNLWLNEGFATWMENRPVAAWHPEWNIPEDVATDLNNTLNLDAQHTTRTIRAEANTPDEINEMFDGITYGKAGAMLLMVENYEGEETFRKGVHNYLSAHMYGNATAEDFWNAQTEVSHKPIDKIMESFVAEPGEPILHFENPQPGSVSASQQRFYLSPSMKAQGAQAWAVPVCFKADANGADCEVFSVAEGSIKTPQAPFLFANARGKGYYRSSYSEDVYTKLVAHVEDGLTPEERISLLGDQWAQVRADKASVASFLQLASAVKSDDSSAVVETALTSVGSISNQIADTQEERQALAAWVRTNFKPALDRLGAPSAADSPEKRELRATLFRSVGNIGKDPDVIAEAKIISARYLADQSSVDATLAQPALSIAAANGDSAFFDQLQTIAETSPNPELQERALNLLAAFQDPALERRAFAYTISGKVRNQDSPYLLVAMLRGPQTRELAWQLIQQNWDQVSAQVTKWSGATVVSGTSSFCSAERRDEIIDFYSTHKVHAAERALSRAKDQMNDCIELRASQGPKLKQWIAGQ